jgi:3-deoxy-D-manno-octulosonate 8-phosphate phosphatase (KDO 8-P phosphatase)
MDVDGVLTDGKLHFGNDGAEFKTFDVQDGHGIAMAQRAGLMIGFISGRRSKATACRAKDLGVRLVLQAPVNKMQLVERVKRKHGFGDEEVAFIGDELVDLPVLRRVGFAAAVANAMPEVKAAAHYVTRRVGGDGAVREVIEMILKARGDWNRVIAKYLLLLVAGLMMSGGRLQAGTAPTTLRDNPPATDSMAGYIEKFEVPEHDEAGNLCWKLAGDRAQLHTNGWMRIINCRTEFYTTNVVDMVFTSPDCWLDQVNKKATTDAPVRIEHGNVVITGVGADWSSASRSFVVRSNVQTVITGNISLMGEPKGSQ